MVILPLLLLVAALWNNRQAGPERCGFDEQRLSCADSAIEPALARRTVQLRRR